MYGGSLLFLLYVYGAVLMHPRWTLSTTRLQAYFRLHLEPGGGGAATVYRHSNSLDSAVSNNNNTNCASHSGAPAGSTYLRLGCIGKGSTFFMKWSSYSFSLAAFGVIGVVYYGVNVFLCISDYKEYHCDKSMIAMHLLALVFVFVQMHFVFCNYKVTSIHYFSHNFWNLYSLKFELL